MILRGKRYFGEVIGREAPRFKHRWFGILEVKIGSNIVSLYMSGTIAQWFLSGDKVEVIVKERPKRKDDRLILDFDDYELYKFYNDERIKVWPVFVDKMEVPRKDPVTGKVVYKYKLRAREAKFESDYEAIAELEQYHYASQKLIIAVWRCEHCGTLIKSNTKPICPKCKTDENVHILEIRGSTPASRFLIIELLEREPYEPRVVAYVRVDPPVPLMHRKVNDEVIENIRERVFPKEWFENIFSPEETFKELFSELRSRYSLKVARHKLWQRASEEAMRICNSAASRIARVVVHPDYRADGLGMLAVKTAVEWIEKRRIPEMRMRKHLVETIAQMARFNPFFEKAGFYYVWDTASGKPVLYKPLTREAEEYLRMLDAKFYFHINRGILECGGIILQPYCSC